MNIFFNSIRNQDVGEWQSVFEILEALTFTILAPRINISEEFGKIVHTVCPSLWTQDSQMQDADSDNYWKTTVY